MNKFQRGWFVIYTKPQQEKKVALMLTARDIHSFLPMRKTLRVWHDRKKYIHEPLFPSYVFVYLKDGQDYYSSLEIEGVTYYVKLGKELTRVKDEVVNNIQLLTSFGEDTESTATRFEEGQRLVIQNGPLSGLHCEVIRHDGKQKVLVRVSLLNRNLTANMPARSLIDQ